MSDEIRQKGARARERSKVEPPADRMRALLLLVGAIVFLDTMFFVVLTPLLPRYTETLALGKGGAGLLQAAYPAGTLIAAIPSGIVAARLGVKRTVSVGLAMLSLASIAFSLAHTAWELDTARFVQGISSAFSWTGSLAWLVAAAPAGRRGRLIGTAMGVAIGGALFGPVLGGLASVVGTRPVFAAIAGLALALLVWASWTPSVAPGDPQPLSALRKALRAPSLLAAVWFVMLPGLMFGTLSVLGPLRLSQLGFGAVAIGAIWLISATLEAVLAPALGHLSDRIGRLRPLLLALAASTVLLLGLPWPGNPYLLGAVIAGCCVAFGSFWSPAMSLLADASERQRLDYGYAFALMNLAWAPGQVLGAAAGGALALATADAVPYAMLAAVCALTLAALWRARRPSLPARAS
ncbi:MAG: MFS transporter [Gaiellaceae bacterium]